ncbi:hypothetical protein GcC1_133015 [Golovinomyces cichoracearum]|uniref:Uncharacterized protein n=1 Tax=Golovinomyces cichoracearum TaxID=62708 RepID=A0A420I3J4_9PEZI|nr:hypothetical protein GcC1_133015 [Golovinomyces cichoracearum]
MPIPCGNLSHTLLSLRPVCAISPLPLLPMRAMVRNEGKPTTRLRSLLAGIVAVTSNPTRSSTSMCAAGT